MSNVVALEDRIKRFDAVTANTAAISEDYGLLKAIDVNPIHYGRIIMALNYYLYANLNAWYENKTFQLTENLLNDYASDIVNLPNITPNGLVLPKTENCAAYNMLHREFAAAFGETTVGEHIDRIQYPINVRLQSGLPNPVIDSRPRSSVKPHTDIWAGDPAAAIVVFLSVLGDPNKSGIRFKYPEIFPTAFVRPLDDFNQGKEVVDHARDLPCQLQNGKWLLMDPYMIHQTTKNGSGLRVSIDLRFIPKVRIDSDWIVEEQRDRYFISFEKWSKIGTEYWMATPDSIKHPIRKTNTDYTVSYPVDIRLTEPALNAL